jgi:nitrous oxide reductase accessory protein NosL
MRISSIWLYGDALSILFLEGLRMKKHKNFYLMGTSFIILWFSFLLAPFFGTDAKEEPKWCPLCGMNLKMYHQTNNQLTFFDGTKTQTCSIFCAAQIYEKRAVEIDRWEVMDYSNQIFIDAKKAHWLMGSDVPGVMTALSKIAFASLEDAQKYLKGHGGAIGTFDDALNRTLSDMGLDRKMIMARVAERAKMGKDLAGRHGCYKCHGEEGKSGSASGWNTPEFSKKMSTRIKIKEAITKGVPGMPGYEGSMDEKDLHSITLYIWSVRPSP